MSHSHIERFYIVLIYIPLFVELFNIWLYRNDKEIYHFAEDRSFTQAIQEIKIEKGDSLSFVECWNSLIIDKGKYEARALFCATKEEKTKKFTISDKKGDEYSPFP
ncbi:MAG TPA: hypothetical protein ENH75_12625 [archaeon]|nr:hypothetical protein [archaeon]